MTGPLCLSVRISKPQVYIGFDRDRLRLLRIEHQVHGERRLDDLIWFRIRSVSMYVDFSRRRCTGSVLPAGHPDDTSDLRIHVDADVGVAQLDLIERYLYWGGRGDDADTLDVRVMSIPVHHPQNEILHTTLRVARAHCGEIKSKGKSGLLSLLLDLTVQGDNSDARHDGGRPPAQRCDPLASTLRLCAGAPVGAYQCKVGVSKEDEAAGKSSHRQHNDIPEPPFPHELLTSTAAARLARAA